MRNGKFWDTTELLTTDKTEAMSKKSEKELIADQREEQEFKNAVITGKKNEPLPKTRASP